MYWKFSNFFFSFLNIVTSRMQLARICIWAGHRHQTIDRQTKIILHSNKKKNLTLYKWFWGVVGGREVWLNKTFVTGGKIPSTLLKKGELLVDKRLRISGFLRASFYKPCSLEEVGGEGDRNVEIRQLASASSYMSVRLWVVGPV